MRAVHDELGVVTESWSPFARKQARLRRADVVARGRRGARRHPRPGDAALAPPARHAADPEVGDPVAAAREPRPRRLRAHRRRDGRDHRRWPGRTAAGSAATPTPTRSSDGWRRPTTPYLRVDLDRLRRNVRRAADVGQRRNRVALRPHAKTHKSPEIARLQLGARRGRASPWRRSARPRSSPGTAAPTCSSPTRVHVDERGRRPAARPGRARPDRDRRRLGRGRGPGRPAARAVRRRGGRRGRQRPAPHRLPARGGGRRRGRRGAGRAHGARRVHLPRATATHRTAMAAAAADEARALATARDAVEREGLEVAVVSGGSTPSLGPPRHRRASPRPGRASTSSATPSSGSSARMPPGVDRADLPGHRGQPRRRPRWCSTPAARRWRADRAAYSTGCGPAARPPGRADRPALGAPRGGRPRRRAAPPGRQPARRRAQPLLRRGQPRRRPLGRGARRPAALAGRGPGPERLSARLLGSTACRSASSPSSCCSRPPPWRAAATTTATTRPRTRPRRRQRHAAGSGRPGRRHLRLPGRRPDPGRQGGRPAAEHARPSAARSRPRSTTTLGDMTFTLDADKAPCTVNSFVSLASRATSTTPPATGSTTLDESGIAVLQCGDPTGTGTGGPGYTYRRRGSTAPRPTARASWRWPTAARHQRLAVLHRLRRLAARRRTTRSSAPSTTPPSQAIRTWPPRAPTHGDGPAMTAPKPRRSTIETRSPDWPDRRLELTAGS